MSVLTQILESKRLEVARRKEAVGVRKLEAHPNFQRTPHSLRLALAEAPGIIAEFKRQSPSKGLIRPGADPTLIARAYAKAGAVAVSVLTDAPYFGGCDEDLQRVRAVVEAPLLRKDFIIDEYQILEARALGADLILLIAAALNPQAIRSLARMAHQLGLEVLLELHDASEIDHIDPDIALIGVNSRNLNSFHTSLETTHRLALQLPSDKLWVAESGLHRPADLEALQQLGYRGFLIGEALMKADDPGAACAAFSAALQTSTIKSAMS